MGEITKETVRCVEEAFKRKEHFPLTIWEKVQLVRAWERLHLNEGTVPASVPADPVLTAFVTSLRAYADNEYSLGIRMAGWHGPCLGWEAKVKAGLFGRTEKEAHDKMNRHLGAHFGIHAAIKQALEADLASAPPPEAREPIDMVLHCPECGMQHIDAPDTLEKIVHQQSGTVVDEVWTNPPHKSHLCHGCGHIWRPADVPTNGVAAVKTTGKADSPIAATHPKEPTEPQGENHG